ncbi:hypothetical protein ABI582_13405 [Pseudomonas sp. SAS7]|uniref:hypothetical protein n=1 Tax=Pseudomonas sp. SAS7 TaxID=3156487 RepID=UPI003F989208
MQTLLSGLSEQASRAYVGASFDDAFSIQWKPAAQFMAGVDLTHASGAHQRVWLYRAPWSWLADGATVDVAAALHQWQAEQRAVLQLRRTLRQRLILVNIDRVTPQALFERLGLAYNDQPVQLFTDPLAATLAGVFEQMAPESWTLYEALEAAAWLPNGEPEFRSNRPLPTTTGLIELLDLIHAGRQLPNAQLQLHERERAITSLRRETDQARNTQQSRNDEREQVLSQLHRAQQALADREAESQRLKDQHSSLQQQLAQAQTDKQQAIQAAVSVGSKPLAEENQLLLAQLHDVQEELEKRHQAGLSLEQQVAALKLEAAQARATQQKAQQAHADSSVAQRYKEESELLLAQLHEVQEELEKRHLESQGFNDKYAKLKKELDQTLAAQQQAGVDLAGATANAQALGEENELLLSQLHLVQEELENYYLANREILAAMDQSNHTLHRARKVISRVAANV